MNGISTGLSRGQRIRLDTGSKSWPYVDLERRPMFEFLGDSIIQESASYLDIALTLEGLT